MTRVMIIGNAGGGKSTIARRLGRILGLPLYSIDQMQWRPGWAPASKSEIADSHQAVLHKGHWILDGWGSWELIEKRLARCDTVILVDRPIWHHYWWALKRQVTCLFRPRIDGPKGCPMLPVTLKLFKMMWSIHKDTMPKLREMVGARSADRVVFVIRSQADCVGLFNHAAQQGIQASEHH